MQMQRIVSWRGRGFCGSSVVPDRQSCSMRARTSQRFAVQFVATNPPSSQAASGVAICGVQLCIGGPGLTPARPRRWRAAPRADGRSRPGSRVDGPAPGSTQRPMQTVTCVDATISGHNERRAGSSATTSRSRTLRPPQRRISRSRRSVRPRCPGPALPGGGLTSRGDRDTARPSNPERPCCAASSPFSLVSPPPSS